MNNEHINTPRTPIASYERAHIALPKGANTATITVVPLEMVFVNIAATPEDNVDRVFYDLAGYAAFLDSIGFAWLTDN